MSSNFQQSDQAFSGDEEFNDELQLVLRDLVWDGQEVYDPAAEAQTQIQLDQSIAFDSRILTNQYQAGTFRFQNRQSAEVVLQLYHDDIVNKCSEFGVEGIELRQDYPSSDTSATPIQYYCFHVKVGTSPQQFEQFMTELQENTKIFELNFQKDEKSFRSLIKSSLIENIFSSLQIKQVRLSDSKITRGKYFTNLATHKSQLTSAKKYRDELERTYRGFMFYFSTLKHYPKHQNVDREVTALRSEHYSKFHNDEMITLFPELVAHQELSTSMTQPYCLVDINTSCIQRPNIAQFANSYLFDIFKCQQLYQSLFTLTTSQLQFTDVSEVWNIFKKQPTIAKDQLQISFKQVTNDKVMKLHILGDPKSLRTYLEEIFQQPLSKQEFKCVGSLQLVIDLTHFFQFISFKEYLRLNNGQGTSDQRRERQKNTIEKYKGFEEAIRKEFLDGLAMFSEKINTEYTQDGYVNISLKQQNKIRDLLKIMIFAIKLRNRLINEMIEIPSYQKQRDSQINFIKQNIKKGPDFPGWSKQQFSLPIEQVVNYSNNISVSNSNRQNTSVSIQFEESKGAIQPSYNEYPSSFETSETNHPFIAVTSNNQIVTGISLKGIFNSKFSDPQFAIESKILDNYTCHRLKISADYKDHFTQITGQSELGVYFYISIQDDIFKLCEFKTELKYFTNLQHTLNLFEESPNFILAVQAPIAFMIAKGDGFMCSQVNSVLPLEMITKIKTELNEQ